MFIKPSDNDFQQLQLSSLQMETNISNPLLNRTLSLIKKPQLLFDFWNQNHTLDEIKKQSNKFYSTKLKQNRFNKISQSQHHHTKRLVRKTYQLCNQDTQFSPKKQIFTAATKRRDNKHISRTPFDPICLKKQRQYYKTIKDNISLVIDRLQKLQQFTTDTILTLKQQILNSFMTQFISSLSRQCHQKAQTLQFLWNSMFTIIELIIYQSLQRRKQNQKKYLNQTIENHKNYQKMLEEYIRKNNQLIQQNQKQKLFANTMVFNIRCKKRQIKKLYQTLKICTGKVNQFKDNYLDLQKDYIDLLIQTKNVCRENAMSFFRKRQQIIKDRKVKIKFKTMKKLKTKNNSETEDADEQLKTKIQLNNAFKEAYNKAKQTYTEGQLAKLKHLDNVQLQNVVDEITNYNLNDEIDANFFEQQLKTSYADAETDTNGFYIDVEQQQTQFDMNEKFRHGVVKHQAVQVSQQLQPVQKNVFVHNRSCQVGKFDIKRLNLQLNNVYDLNFLFGGRVENEAIKRMKMLINQKNNNQVDTEVRDNNQRKNMKDNQSDGAMNVRKISNLTNKDKKRIQIADDNESVSSRKQNRAKTLHLQFRATVTERQIKTAKNIEQDRERFKRLRKIERQVSHEVDNKSNSNINRRTVKFIELGEGGTKRQISNDNKSGSKKKNKRSVNLGYYSQHVSPNSKNIQNKSLSKNINALSTPKWTRKITSKVFKTHVTTQNHQPTPRPQQNYMCHEQLQFTKNPLKTQLMNSLASKVLKKAKLNKRVKLQPSRLLQGDLKFLQDKQSTNFIADFTFNMQPFLLELFQSIDSLQSDKKTSKKAILTSLREKNLCRIISSTFLQVYHMLNKGEMIFSMMKPLYNCFRNSYGSLKSYQFYYRLLNFIQQIYFYRNESVIFNMFLILSGIDNVHHQDVLKNTSKSFIKLTPSDVQLFFKLFKTISMNFNQKPFNIQNLYTNNHQFSSSVQKLLTEQNYHPLIIEKILSKTQMRMYNQSQKLFSNFGKQNMQLQIDEEIKLDSFLCCEFLIKEIVDVRNTLSLSYLPLVKLMKNQKQNKDTNDSQFSVKKQLITFILDCHYLPRKMLNELKKHFDRIFNLKRSYYDYVDIRQTNSEKQSENHDETNIIQQDFQDTMTFYEMGSSFMRFNIESLVKIYNYGLNLFKVKDEFFLRFDQEKLLKIVNILENRQMRNQCELLRSILKTIESQEIIDNQPILIKNNSTVKTQAKNEEIQVKRIRNIIILRAVDKLAKETFEEIIGPQFTCLHKHLRTSKINIQ